MSQGLRLATVGFAESLVTLAKTDISQANITTTKLLEIMAAQKYLQTPLKNLAYQQKEETLALMAQRKNWLYLCSIIFGTLALVTFLIVWICSVKILLERLKSARNIVGMIPMQVFAKNQKFTKAYEEELGHLII